VNSCEYIRSICIYIDCVVVCGSAVACGSAAVCGAAMRAAVCCSAHISVRAVRVAVCNSALGSVWQCARCAQQCVTMCAVVCGCPAVCGSVRQCAAVCSSVWQCAAVCGSVRLPGSAMVCSSGVACILSNKFKINSYKFV